MADRSKNMEAAEDYHTGLRARANTLEKSEQIRPPRRKRRSHYDLETSTCTAVSSQHRVPRSESMPPPSTTTSMMVNNHKCLLSPPAASTIFEPTTTTSMTSPPHPEPRIRRLTTRQKMAFGYPVSQPSSGNNTPNITRGSSALDLSDLTPFGTFGNTGLLPKSGSLNRPLRHSVKSSRSPGTHKWNWIWNRASGSGSGNNGGKESPDSFMSSTLRHTGSFLGRKRKSRHISCPDIHCASNESSRSSSPVSFKVSLTSLFGHHHGGGHHYIGGGGPRNNAKSRLRPLNIAHSAPTTSTSNTSARSVTASQHVQDSDLAIEIIEELKPVQYCQIYYPFECFCVEVLDSAASEKRAKSSKRYALARA